MQADTTTITMDDAGRTGLGPAILGGLIGAAVGIALDAFVETGAPVKQWQFEAQWFPIVIGVLTGLGVRMMNKHHMQRSYVRGAISGILALGAIVLSTYTISLVMKSRDASVQNDKPLAAKAEAAEQTAEDQGAAEAAKTEPAVEPAAAVEPMVGGAGRIRQDKLNPWQFVFMAVGALAAYELGRGVEHSRRAESIGVAEPMPVATDPSN